VHGWRKSAAESGGSRAGAYVLGTINTNSCPAGSSFITAAAQCQAAATALGLRDGGSTIYAFQPRGCARSASTSGVEYNSHASGAADPDYTPVCAVLAGSAAAMLCSAFGRTDPRPSSAAMRGHGDCRLDGPHDSVL
jgi:hypothetical protein